MEKILKEIKEELENEYITVKGSKIYFKIQNGPIKKNGKNGCQIENLGKAWLKILQKLNKTFPCRENSLTITKIQEALMWNEARTKNRIEREVEGYNKR